MITLYRKITQIFIIVGVCMLTINWLYGTQTINLISMERIPHTNVYWYKINMQEYILNIRDSFQQAIYLRIEEVPQTWIDNADFSQFANNNIPLIVNWCSLIINILILPIRVCFYILKGVLALMGARVMNTPENNGIFWIIKICNWVVEKMQIPYIT